MAKVWGPKGDGSNGVMDEGEIIEYLYEISKWAKSKALDKTFRNAAHYMMNHKGKDGGTVHHFDGKTVFHATENCGEATIFFTNKDGSVASIVGVGEHSGPKSKTATYTLKWKSKSWKPTVNKDGRLQPTKQISL